MLLVIEDRCHHHVCLPLVISYVQMQLSAFLSSVDSFLGVV